MVPVRVTARSGAGHCLFRGSNGGNSGITGAYLQGTHCAGLCTRLGLS